VFQGGRPDCPALLNKLQEQMVWEQVIRQTPEGGSLLQIPETAKHAMAAWKSIQAHRLKVDAQFEASEDWAAFAAWSRGFLKLCQANGWLEGARLSDAVAKLFKADKLLRPEMPYVAGFDELTPQRAGSCATTQAKSEPPPRGHANACKTTQPRRSASSLYRT
jgi:hypothetical protein